MKLWDSLTACLMLLSAVHAGSLLLSASPEERPLEQPRGAAAGGGGGGGGGGGEQYTMEEPPLDRLEDVVDFIKVTVSRIRRSSSSTVTSSTSASATSAPSSDALSSRQRRERRKGASQQSGKRARGETAKKVGGRGGRGGGRGGGGNGRGLGCVLKQIHLNVSDLGLGYRSGEEMIFRYCSGPCRKSETNYDKILHNLVHHRRLPAKDTPPQACCRPVAFDDDLSFLDDNLVYHTVRKHSARKCACV